MSQKNSSGKNTGKSGNQGKDIPAQGKRVKEGLTHSDNKKDSKGNNISLPKV